MTMPSDSPQDVLASALAYRDRLAFDKVVALCEPVSLATCFREYCDGFRVPTPADLAAGYPQFSEEKRAALRAALVHRSDEAKSRIRREIPGTNGYEVLMALTPAEFLRRALEGSDLRCQVIRGMKRRGLPLSPALFDPPEGMTYEILAPEPLSNSDVRLTYRVRGVDPERDQTIEFEDLRQNPAGEWQLIARRDLLETRGSVGRIVTPEVLALIEDDER